MCGDKVTTGREEFYLATSEKEKRRRERGKYGKRKQLLWRPSFVNVMALFVVSAGWGEDRDSLKKRKTGTVVHAARKSRGGRRRPQRLSYTPALASPEVVKPRRHTHSKHRVSVLQSSHPALIPVVLPCHSRVGLPFFFLFCSSGRRKWRSRFPVVSAPFTLDDVFVNYFWLVIASPRCVFSRQNLAILDYRPETFSFGLTFRS